MKYRFFFSRQFTVARESSDALACAREHSPYLLPFVFTLLCLIHFFPLSLLFLLYTLCLARIARCRTGPRRSLGQADETRGSTLPQRHGKGRNCAPVKDCFLDCHSVLSLLCYTALWFTAGLISNCQNIRHPIVISESSL